IKYPFVSVDAMKFSRRFPEKKTGRPGRPAQHLRPGFQSTRGQAPVKKGIGDGLDRRRQVEQEYLQAKEGESAPPRAEGGRPWPRRRNCLKWSAPVRRSS